MKINKSFIIKLLIGFIIAALLLTYISTQIYTSSLPTVKTTKSISATMQASANVSGQIAYDNIISYSLPVEVTVSDVFVKSGQKVKENSDLLKLNVDSLKTQKEELENQVIQAKIETEDTVKSEEVLLLQIEIAKMERSLFKSNRELEKLIEDKKDEANLFEYKENIEKTNLQMRLAQEALYNYSAPIRYDGEERSLMRAIERIKVQLAYPNLPADKKAELEEQLKSAELDLQVYRKIPSSLSSGYDLSQELSLKLSLLEAKHNLLETDEYYGEEKTSAQARYEESLLEYQQAKLKNAAQIQIDEKKLELSLVQYEQQLNELNKSGGAKLKNTMKLQELKTSLNQIDTLIKDDGLVKTQADGEVILINVDPNQKLLPEQVLLTFYSRATNASVLWKTETDDFNINDEVTATLNVYEEIEGDKGKEIIEKEKDIKLKITSKRFVASESLFEYEAIIPQKDETSTEGKSDDKDTIKLAMSNSQSVKLSMSKQLDEYDTVVPVSAISFITETKGTLFCVVENKQGKPVARKLEVEILDYDQTNAALKDSIKDKIVVYSDRPLKSEGEIREDE